MNAARRLLPLLSATMSLFAGCDQRATPEQRAQIDEHITAAVAHAVALDAERVRKVRAAMAEGLDAERGACPVIVNPTWDTRVEHVSGAIGGRAGPRLDYVQREAERVRLLLDMEDVAEDQRPARLVAWSATLQALSWWDWDLTLVVDAAVRPGVLTPQLGAASAWAPTQTIGTMERGVVRGRAYLYSYRDRKVICAGPFAATNSSSIEIDALRDLPGTEEQKQRSAVHAASSRASWDLDREAIASAAAGLRAFDPP